MVPSGLVCNGLKESFVRYSVNANPKSCGYWLDGWPGSLCFGLLSIAAGRVDGPFRNSKQCALAVLHPQSSQPGHECFVLQLPSERLKAVEWHRMQ